MKAKLVVCNRAGSAYSGADTMNHMNGASHTNTMAGVPSGWTAV